MQQFRPSVAWAGREGWISGPTREIPAKKPRSAASYSGQERAARIQHEINNKISQFRVWRVAPENHGSPLNAYVTRPRDGEFSLLLFPPLFFLISRKTFLVNNNPTLYCKIIYFGNRNV